MLLAETKSGRQPPASNRLVVCRVLHFRRVFRMRSNYCNTKWPIHLIGLNILISTRPAYVTLFDIALSCVGRQNEVTFVGSIA